MPSIRLTLVACAGAALLFGIERDWPLERCIELGNHVGAIKIACKGGQNHVLDRTALGV